MNNLHILDISIVGVYLILCLIIGLGNMKKIKNIRDYTLGTTSVSKGMLIATLFATSVGAASTVGAIEKVYSLGLLFAIALMFSPCFWFVTAKIFSSNIARFQKAGCISISDVMEVLYGKTGKWITNVASICMSIGVVALQIAAIGYLLNYFLAVPREVCVLIGFGVVVIYSIFGGVRAVIVTDAFQSFILLIGIPAACFAAYYDIGGYDGVIKNLPISHLSLDISKDNIVLFLSLVFYFFIPSSSGTYVQRFLMASDKKQLNDSLQFVALMSIPLVIIVILIGFIVKAKAPEVSSSQAFFFLVSSYLPIGIKGLVIAGILAAIMSTADSWLNTASVLCSHDIIKTIFPKITEKQELRIAQLSLLLIATLGAILALYGGKSIIGLRWIAGSFWDPVILVPLAAGFLGFKTNTTSFLGAAITGVLCVLIGAYLAGEFATISLSCGLIGGALGLFGTHLLQSHALWKAPNNWRTDIIYEKYNKICSRLFQHIKFNTLHISIQRRIEKHGEYYYQLGIFGLVYYLVSSLTCTFTDSSLQLLVIGLRLGALVLCFLLCMHEVYTSKKWRKKYMPLFWYFSLCYCFPFLSIYTVYISGGDFLWLVNSILSEFLLYVFAGWYACITLSCIGMVIAFALFAANDYVVALHINNYAGIIVFLQVLCAAVIFFFLKQRESNNEDKLEAKLLYSNGIAHEVINPLHGSAMMADVLITTFANKDNPSQISQGDFEDIKRLLHPFKESSMGALKTIDRMLNLVRTDISVADDIGVYSIDECVESSLDLYGLSVKDLKRIQVRKENNFKFKGSKHFLIHVINNLISNALKHAGSASNIYIWYEDKELHFKDDGYGIAPNKLPHIFQAFDKKGCTSGTGIGLPFCKQVMVSMGGGIECNSTLGNGTEFILVFAEAYIV